MYRRFFPPGSHRAMAGGTEAHAQFILRLLVTLAGGLAGGPCRVYPSDMKLAAGGNEYYPDAFVVCGAPMLANRRVVDDAVLVCEVRSESTAAFDMGEKFAAYQQVPSLREYLLLDTRRPEATFFRKDAQGGWSSGTIGGEAVLVLASV